MAIIYRPTRFRSGPVHPSMPQFARVACNAVIDPANVRAIDVHTHAEVGADGHDPMPPELREASARYFHSREGLPTATDVAAHYRERNMAAVVFTVDYESVSGRLPVSNEEVAEAAAANPDVLIPFASIHPARGRAGAREARRLVAEHGVRGFKFHPNLQAFFPNDRNAYPLYEAIAEAGVPALFHSGHSGIGAGLPGGGGIRLKYSKTTCPHDLRGGLPAPQLRPAP